ncbi:IS66 family transposase [Limosilactobacillus ingluviei]|uniref:IS66 family transposase n=1 Tax=Limosilactobacillus ingluviei TaxID=148604 RepID=UPI003D2F3A61
MQLLCKHGITALDTIDYALNRNERVYQIFEHGELPLDNNYDEQLIRLTTIGRKIPCLRKPKLGLKLTPFGLLSFKRLS